MKKIKIKEHHRRDFEAYVRFRRESRSGFLPWKAPDIPLGDGDPIASFVAHDASGQVIPSSDPELTKHALEGKTLLNFEIKGWAQGYQDCGGLFWVEEELKADYPWLPEWVWESMINQVAPKSNERYTRYKEECAKHTFELRPSKVWEPRPVKPWQGTLVELGRKLHG